MPKEELLLILPCCGKEIKIPLDSPGDLLNWRAVFCPECEKQFVYDYDTKILIK